MTERHRMTRGGGEPPDPTDPGPGDPAELAARIPREGSPGVRQPLTDLYTDTPVEGDDDPTELARRIPRRH